MIRYNNIRKLFLYFFIFVFIYQPVIYGIDNFIIYAFFLCIYIFIYILSKNKSFFKLFNKKVIVLYTLTIITSAIYFTCRTIIAGTSITDFSSIRIVHGLMPIVYLTSALIINYEMNQLKLESKDKFKMILNVAIFQGLIALAMFIFPRLKVMVLNIYESAGGKDIYFVTDYRIYGICNGDYTYALQIIHGILATMAIVFAYYYKEKKYYFFSMIILSVTFLNGRFGILIFIIEIIFFILTVLFSNKKNTRIFGTIIMILFIFAIMYYIISNFMPNVVVIFKHAINDVFNYNEGQTDTETGRLVEMHILPKNILFGEGYRIFGKSGEKYGEFRSSDVGYTNDLFMGGLIYSFLLYNSILILIKEILRQNEKNSFQNKYIKIFILGIILANIKGEIFRSVTIQTFMILILTLLLFNEGNLLLSNAKDNE